MLHPRDIHCGEIFYECSGMGCAEMKAITAPYKENGTWKWKARNMDTQEVVNYVWTSHVYGPTLYDHPAYIDIGAEQEHDYPEYFFDMI